MKNHWIKQFKNEKLNKFRFFNMGRTGIVYNVDHPTMRQFGPEGELVSLTTRILITPVNNVRIIWTPDKEHGKKVVKQAELFIDDLRTIAYQTMAAV